jgi:hypothetical protein
MHPLISKWISVILLACATGCTSYAQFTGDYRTRISNQHYTQALEKLDGVKKGRDKLLFLLENGIIAHHQKDHEKSNRYFAAAEKHSDELFTKSISRQATSLITNDAIKNYRGESFEWVAIHYYRALNYWYLGQTEDALVECRKANLKLAKYAIHNGETSYKNDAFIHYITGLFYEATGEYNDAYISFQHAREAYVHYAVAFQVAMPQPLEEDLKRVSALLNGDELAEVSPFSLPVGDGELVIFTEIGLVPRKIQEEIDLPIYKNDIKRSHHVKATILGNDISNRRHRPQSIGDVDYWLRVTLPKYETVIPETHAVHITAGNRETQTLSAQNYGRIAQATLNDHYSGIVARTTARSLVKFLAYRKVKKKNKVLGFLTNLLNVSTEIADTRSWVSLPYNIQIGRLSLSPGKHTIKLEAQDVQGHTIETQMFENVEISPGQRTFISHRFYR